MYIVNKWGVTHSVADRQLLPGERLATAEEIVAYDVPNPVKTAVVSKQTLEMTNAIAERDAEIEKLKAELASKAKK